MKKVFFIVIISILLISLSIVSQKIYMQDADCVYVYTLGKEELLVKNENTNIFGMTRYSVDYDDISKIQRNFDDIVSIEFTYKNISIDEIITKLNCVIVSWEKIENVLVYYLYSNLIDDCIEVDNRYINVQVAISSENVKIGIPLLVGEY